MLLIDMSWGGLEGGISDSLDWVRKGESKRYQLVQTPRGLGWHLS